MSFSVGQIQSCLVRVHFEELLRGSESGAKCYPLGQNSVVAGPHKMGAEMGHNFFIHLLFYYIIISKYFVCFGLL